LPHEDLKLPAQELPPLKTMATTFKTSHTVVPTPETSQAALESQGDNKAALSSKDWLPLPTPETSQAVLPTAETSQTMLPVTYTSQESLVDIKAALSSKDWMLMSTLGNHVDISYNPQMFCGSDSESVTNDVHETALTAELLPAKTNWNSLFLSQLQLVPPSPCILSERIHSISSVVSAPDMNEESLSPAEYFYSSPTASSTLPLQSEEVQADTVASSPEANEEMDNETTEQQPKKRKRRPRKKIVPKVKEYVEPTDVDVLLGRGGRSNHHPGNKRYREEVQNLHSWYLGVEEKNEKTDLSQCLVDYVHSYNGRFLHQDEAGWYVVLNIIARRKASQALREDNDAAKRAAKRTRFLQKKELEAGKQLEG
jgi:hypothetical protein